MFDELSEKLEATFARLRGRGLLTEADIKEGLREVRRVLLEAPDEGAERGGAGGRARCGGGERRSRRASRSARLAVAWADERARHRRYRSLELVGRHPRW